MSTDLPFETAGWLHRMLALLVDWAAATLVVVAFVGWDAYVSPEGPEQLYILLTYVGESALLTWFAGGSFGKLVTGLRTVPADGRVRVMNPLVVLLRQVLIALVIPPLVFKSDGRGLHDLFARTATVTAPTFHTLVGVKRP